MKTAEAKIASANLQQQSRQSQGPFFKKEGETAFLAEQSATSSPFFIPTTLQPKLTIGQPNDKYEVEADQVADQVVQRLAEPDRTTDTFDISDTSHHSIPISTIQRKCKSCTEKESQRDIEEQPIQRQASAEPSISENSAPIASESSSMGQLNVTPASTFLTPEPEREVEEEQREEEVWLQRKPVFESSSEIQEEQVQRKCASCEQEEKLHRRSDQVATESTASASLTSKLNSSKGSGSSLSEQTRSIMESAFGVDFADVRIHTNSSAVEMNKELNAQAFTHGFDIYFNSGKYNPGSKEGDHLLAHELTHTVQQGRGVRRKEQVVQQNSPKKVQRSWIGDAWDATGGKVVSGVKSGAAWAGDRVVAGAKLVGNTVVDGVKAGKEWLLKQAEKLAPTLFRFLRGDVLGTIKDKVVSAIDQKFGGVFSTLESKGLAGVIGEALSNLLTSITTGSERFIAESCEEFAKISETILKFIKRLSSKTLSKIKKYAKKIGDFFSTLWSDFGSPAIEFIKKYAGKAWDWINRQAQRLWDLTSPIRKLLAKAWDYVKEKFGIAWESTEGTRSWLTEKLMEAWRKIEEKIKPFIGPLKIVAAVFLLLSPFGPLILIWKGAPYIWDLIVWIAQHWDDSSIVVEARTYISKTLIPKLQEGIIFLRDTIRKAVTWMRDVMGQLVKGLGKLGVAVRNSAIFRVLTSLVDFIIRKVDEVLTFFADNLYPLFEKFVALLNKIWDYVKPVLAVLLKLAIVLTLIVNPMGWPILVVIVMAWMWRVLPECYKGPIIDFILRFIIGALRVLPDFKSFGESWAIVKAMMINQLQETLKKSTEEKVQMANRLAEMISELQIEIVSNQIAALRETPKHFLSEMEQELTGVDANKPLDFEVLDPNSQGVGALVSNSGDLAGEEMETSGLLADFMAKGTFTDSDIIVDSVGQFLPEDELIESLNLNEEGVQEFGESNEEDRTIQAILEELAIVQGGIMPETAEQGGESGDEINPAELDPEGQIQYLIDQPIETPCGKDEHPPEKADEPVARTLGPFTPGQRRRYFFSMIWKGIKHWFDCNKSWLIPTIVGSLLVYLILAILTEGVLLEATPAILEVLSIIMLGVAAVRAGMYFGLFGAQSLVGQISEAAKSMARALAIIAIELIFLIVFEGKAILNAIKGGLKGTTHGAKAGVKTAANAASDIAQSSSAAIKGTTKGVAGNAGSAAKAALGTGDDAAKSAFQRIKDLPELFAKGSSNFTKNLGEIKRFIGAVFKDRKLVMKGIRDRFAKGIKHLDDFARKLWEKVRFKKFRIRFTRFFIELQAYINPWVTIMKGPRRGEIVEVDDVAGKLVGEFGDFISKSSDEVIEGMLIGGKEAPSEFVKILQANPNLVKTFRQAFGTGSKINGPDLIKAFRNLSYKAPHELPELLSAVKNLKHVDGIGEVIKDLTIWNGKKVSGAKWVLSFIEKNGLSSLVQALERTAQAGGKTRVYDAVIDGVKYEFKNWSDLTIGTPWTNSLIKQLIRDTKSRRKVLWMFSDQFASSSDELVDIVKDILNNPKLYSKFKDVMRSNGITRKSQLTELLPRIERFVERNFKAASQSTGKVL